MSEKKKCPICSQPAELKCTGCRLVSYCSKEHQKSDWKIHKNICKAYEIKQSSELGRYLIASRDLSPGDTILSELPIVTGPKIHVEEPVKTIPCVGCYTPLLVADPPGRCLSCGWPSCGTNCPGLMDPRASHASECILLRLRTAFAVNNMEDFYRSDALTPLRCLLLQKREPKRWKQILEMQSHQEERGPDTYVYEEIDYRIAKYLLENYVHPMKAFEVASNMKILEDCSSSTIHKICGILDVNSLEIHLNNSTDLIGLYPTAYLMEHSCLPNTKHIFDVSDDLAKQYKITVKACQPIKKGEHITTMYTHALWGTQARREHLKESKYFVCKCQRCSDPTELGTYLSALKCIGTEEAPCGGNQLPLEPLDENSDWVCDKCPVRVASEEVTILVSKIGEEVEQIQSSSPSITVLEKILEKISTFLHPHHYHVYGVKHSLVQLYGYQQGFLLNQLSDDLLKRKSTMCRELLDITKKIDPGNARLSLYSGVLLHELHLAIMQLVKRKWPDGSPKELLLNCIKESINLLEYATVVLTGEEEGSAGHKLSQLIDTDKKDLNRWLDENRVNF